MELAGLATAMLLATAHVEVAGAALARFPPRVLVVTAHPDDETIFAGTLYKIARALQGRVDLAVVTSGEGGYRYATLAEPIYGEPLGDEASGRAHLPRIRKREVMAAGAILGIRAYHFLDQPDRGATRDAAATLGQWDVASVKSRLREILEGGRYGFVLLPLPTTATHGAHQAAALLALEVAAGLPGAERPALLGGYDLARGEPRPVYAGLPGQPLTAVRAEQSVLEFDRSRPLGPDARLDYRIVVNWAIAEHKSQGLLQTTVNAVDRELYYLFDLNEPAAVAAARELFARLGPGRPEPSGHPLPATRWLRLGQDVCPIPR